MKSISLSKRAKDTLCFIFCLMILLSYYLISIACSIPASCMMHMNLIKPTLTIMVLLVFSPDTFTIISAVVAAVLAFIALRRYVKEDDPLHIIIIITICANSIVLFLISSIAAGLLMPFYVVFGTLH